jgi:tetratricopeptide (TPR) repeat protein
VAAIEPELDAAEHFRSQRKPPESLDAWECVIRALSHIGQVTHAGTMEAEALCRRAIPIASDYGQAHSLLAWTLVRRPLWSGDLRTVLPEATAEARTALSLDERDPWAHLTDGAVFFRMRRHGEAVRALRRALELNPNFALAHGYLGAALAIQGAPEEAVKYAAHALRLSPNDRLVGGFASIAAVSAHFAAEQYEDCVASGRETIERYPENQVPHHLLISATATQGDMEAASEALATLLDLRPDFLRRWLNENTPFAGDMLRRLLTGSAQSRSAGGVIATRRLAAILAVDVAGYSRLMGAARKSRSKASRCCAASSSIRRSRSTAAATSRPCSSSSAVWSMKFAARSRLVMPAAANSREEARRSGRTRPRCS